MNMEDFMQEDLTYFENAKGFDMDRVPVFGNIKRALTKFYETRWYFMSIIIIGAIFMFGRQSVAGVATMGIILCLFMVFCEDILATLLPFVTMFLMTVEHYRKLMEYGKVWWIVIPLVLALVFHLIAYAKPVKIGKSFIGLALVSVATLTGGVGVISSKDYFNPLSMYYTLALGIGMLITYLIIKAQVPKEGRYSPLDRLGRVLYAAGLFTGYLVLLFYYQHNNNIFEDGFTTTFFAYRNYCASILLVCMAVPCYYSLRHNAHLIGILFMYFAILLTGSRSGMAFGTVLLIGAIIYIFKYNKKNRRTFIMVILIAAIPFIILDYGLIETLFKSRMVGGTLMYFQDSRIEFFTRAIEDFFRNPIFGSGIGNTGNADVFKGVPGSLSFYHNYAAQIIGSMGLVGIVAYGTLLYGRMSLITKRFNAQSGVFIMGYAGLLLMSMTNPGEFCPLPDELLIIVIFALIEGEEIVERDPETGKRIVPEVVKVPKEKKDGSI